MKRFVVAVALLLSAFLAWTAFHPGEVSVVVNGEQLVGPDKVAGGAWGLLVAAVGLGCAAILLAFVLAGVWLLVLGALVAAGVVAAGVLVPFLLPLLVPLVVVWLVVALVRGRRRPSG